MTPTGPVVVGVLVVHNLMTNLWFPARWYVPRNLGTAAVLVALAGTDDLGLVVGLVPAVIGGGTALAVVAGIGLVAWVPRTRRLLADQRMAGVDARGTAWRALVRIPLGTVVLEEVAFRGVLPALLSPLAAAALFGLWHVVPTWRTLDVNHVCRSVRARSLAVSGAVVVTAVVGLALWELRVFTGSLLAPALVHTAANSGATVAASVVLRSGPTGGAPADLLPHEGTYPPEDEPA